MTKALDKHYQTNSSPKDPITRPNLAKLDELTKGMSTTELLSELTKDYP